MADILKNADGVYSITLISPEVPYGYQWQAQPQQAQPVAAKKSLELVYECPQDFAIEFGEDIPF